MNKPLHLKNIKPFIQLTKPVITLSVAFSALMGFLLASEGFSQGWLILYSGVILIAAGSSAINQIQEASYDKLMDRTHNRPLPSGQIRKSQAWVVAVVLAFLGAALLWVFTAPVSSLLAIFTLLWYNLVYTPLKRISAYAVIPGALVGALPPAIGWSAAGGSLLHPYIILVAIFFFIGQIPHFWLILLKHGQDYQKAGFPAITSIFSQQYISGITLIWVMIMVVAAMALPLTGVIQSDWMVMLVYLMALIVLISFRKWINSKSRVNPPRAFLILNIFYLMMMLTLITDVFLR